MEISDLARTFCEAEEIRACQTHGDYPAIAVSGRWSDCPTCVQSRLKQQDEAFLDRIRHEQSTIQKRQRITASGIPQRFLDKRFDNFVVEHDGQRNAVAKARDYAKNFESALKSGRGCIFTGNRGTGKTHLAAAIGLDVMDRGYSVLYTSVLRALRSVKDGFSAQGESETAVVKRLAVPDLLILDEAGISYETDTEAMILYEIVNQRYEEYKPTIFTSNYTMAELQKVMGDRVIDRLREGGGMALSFAWDSWRAKGGAA